MKDLIDLKRRPVEEVVADLRSESRGASTEAGNKLVAQAADFGLNLRDYLTLAVNTRAGEHAELAHKHQMNGYELALALLDLPIKNDFEQGVVLQAASNTFQTFPGTRALFPEVIDDMLRWQNRQDSIERVEPMISQTRTIAGNELVSTVVLDDSQERGTFTVPELANIPVRTIRTTETAVKMYKHGSAYRTSYEFNRRASLDLLTPYAARVARELELSKVKAATDVLINGDGVNGAATVIPITHASIGGTANALSANYKALAKFLMEMAKDMIPADTLVGNYDMFVDLMFMFSQTLPSNTSQAEKMASVGAPVVNMQLPIMNNSVNFVLSSTMPAGRLLAYNRAETLEHLVESGSQIAESEQAIRNQSIVYVRTENSGFRLAFGDTRRILNTAA
jgi:hypothetical protein